MARPKNRSRTTPKLPKWENPETGDIYDCSIITVTATGKQIPLTPYTAADFAAQMGVTIDTFLDSIQRLIQTGYLTITTPTGAHT